MKQFFYTLFGGLTAIAVGVGIAYGGSVAWRMVRPQIAALEIPVLHTPLLPTEPAGSSGARSSAKSGANSPAMNDGTSISGFARTIRYSAAEEEDLINAAASALPSLSNTNITASGYIIKNLTSDVVVVEHQADQLLPIASLTKLVTAVIAQRKLDPDQHIVMTRSIMGTYGNTAQFKVGETLRADDLLYPLLMVSSNDAAEALAQAGGRRQFIQAMNDFVQSIGAYRTYFDDPSGLSPKNISTARDMALIIDWIRQNDPSLISITDEKARTIRAHTWINPTHFLNWSNYIGGKNGYTPEANRTGITLFKLGPRSDIYAVVVLGSDARDADVIKLLAKVQ